MIYLNRELQVECIYDETKVKKNIIELFKSYVEDRLKENDEQVNNK